jgi:hypothetical protein
MTWLVTEVCPDCGNLRSVCSDPERAFYPQRRMCYATAVRELTLRRLQAKHKQEPGIDDLHPLDGMGVYVSPDDLTPDDDFV